MLSTFLIAECNWGLLSVDRAEAAWDRPIPAAIIAPPTRTFLRDISLLSIVIGSKFSPPSMCHIWVSCPSFEEAL